MMKRALVFVLDSVGCGDAPDAAEYGDAGANTLGHLLQRSANLKLPNLESLGLMNLMGGSRSAEQVPAAQAFRLTETSKGKDTTTGHWELMGCPIEEAFLTFEKFPADLVEDLGKIGQTRFIGNKIASGTEILTELGEEHLGTGHPILYTSADSVLQIAAHEEAFGLERLLELCRQARNLLDDRGLKVGRVIARPFLGEDAASFRRTGNRHDYSLTPDHTVMDRLEQSGVKVIGVGKIFDIFAGAGVSESRPSKSNAEGMRIIDELWADPPASPHFIFANLVDFDSLYGHRRDPGGYARCLMEFDDWLGGFLKKVTPDDLVIITADHGNDPYHPGTDHTREQVPCLVIAPAAFQLPEMAVFSDVAACLDSFFEVNSDIAKSS